MTQPTVPDSIVSVVAAEVRRHRRLRGWSAQRLADACTALGVDMPRGVLANLESGRRESLDVVELMVLARALEVPPIHLLFPVGQVAESAPLPGEVLPTWDALAWFTGETPLTELPDPGSPRGTLEAFRHHGIAVHAAQTSARQAHERRRDVTINLDPTARERLSQTADLYERLAFDDARALKDLRTRMREQGLEPPPLPAALAYVDDARPSGEASA